MSVRMSTADEQPMQASKWLDVQALLDREEMTSLLDVLDSPLLFLTGCVCPEGELVLSRERFLEGYGEYVEALKGGQLPDEKSFRLLFSAAMTVSPEVLYAIPVEGGRQILRLSRPAVQMQFHRMGYSTADGKFRPMAFGSHSIFWGIQFSYPQLFQDMATHEVFAVKEGEAFPNTMLFKSLRRWMRENSVPTPFLADGKKVNAPIRLGKKCLSWINNHPQLKELGLLVVA